MNTYLLSCAYGKLQYIAVTGGALCIGKVENNRGKLNFTSSSFEVSISKLPEFFEQMQQLGENLIVQASEVHHERRRGSAAVSGSASPDLAVPGTSESAKKRDDRASNQAKGKFNLLKNCGVLSNFLFSFC